MKIITPVIARKMPLTNAIGERSFPRFPAIMIDVGPSAPPIIEKELDLHTFEMIPTTINKMPRIAVITGMIFFIVTSPCLCC